MAMPQLFTRKKKRTGRVGISVGSEKISIALVQERNGKPFLAVCESIVLSSQKEASELLTKRVKALELNGLPCNFVMSRRDYVLQLIESPNVEPQEMRKAVRWKIKDLLDMKVDDAALDVFPVPEDAYKGRQNMLYVVAALKTRIKSIAQIVTDSGLNLSVIDIPELAMKNISSQLLDDGYGLGFMDLRKTGSSLNLTRKGDLYLTRRINTQVPPEAMTSPEWQSTRDKLALEIQRTLDYYESQMGQAQISRIVLAPRISDSAAMTEALNGLLSVKVETLDLRGKLEGAVELVPELQQACLTAIGTAMRDRPVAKQAEAA
ncbi:MAG: hypothetical protein WD772_05440 [Pseudohongiellaceae bacterium]